MAREILFKAKSKHFGEWVEGSLIISGDYVCILEKDTEDDWKYPYLNAEIGTFDGEATPIIPETICQYTGLTDNYGNKIWENDIVECKGKNHHFQSQIEWDSFGCGFMFQDTKNSMVGLDAISDSGCYRNYEVIGNVFDNPELLEGGAV